MARYLTKDELRGLIPPMVTPVQLDGSLDLAAIRKLVEHTVEGGVSGLFVLGTCGEGNALSYRKRYQLVELVCEAVAGRVPVLVSVSDTAYEESLELAEHAFASGAAAVVSTGPYFLPVPVGHLESYFQRLADESPLPVVLYNMPGCTKFCLSPEVIRRLANHPRILGIKDSSGDLKYVRELLDSVRDVHFPVLIGPEEILLPAMELGAVGGVNGGGMLFPAVYAQRISAFMQGNYGFAKQADDFVLRLSRQLFPAANGRMAVIESLKASLAVLGLCQPWLLSPLLPLEAEHRERIQRRMSELELEASQLCPATKMLISAI